MSGGQLAESRKPSHPTRYSSRDGLVAESHLRLMRASHLKAMRFFVR